MILIVGTREGCTAVRVRREYRQWHCTVITVVVAAPMWTSCPMYNAATCRPGPGGCDRTEDEEWPYPQGNARSWRT